MIERPTDLYPKEYIEELVRLGRQPFQPFVIIDDASSHNPTAHFAVRGGSSLEPYCHNFADFVDAYAVSMWLVNGPKIARPSPMDVEALSQVECRLMFEDYQQPYPVMLVDFPEGSYYDACLCYHGNGCLLLQLMTKKDHKQMHTVLMERLEKAAPEDIDKAKQIIEGKNDHAGDINFDKARQIIEEPAKNATLLILEVARRSIEEWLVVRKAVAEQQHATEANRLFRVAVNMCLLMSNYEVESKLLFSKELERDKRLLCEKSERGDRARLRAQMAIGVLSFKQEVLLYDTERHAGTHGDGVAGGEVGPHWRKGHWRKQVCGVGRAERKKIFIRPVFVRADKFLGDLQNTQTTYTRRGE